jgi:hypothetical protein
MINYFVSYAFQEGTRTGNGNIDIQCALPITCIERVRFIEQSIRDEHFGPTDTIAVLSWQCFELA